MLVFSDGRTEGTVGGGALEHHAMTKALSLLREGTRTFLESHELRNLGMLCGGKATLFYEVLRSPPLLAVFGAGHVGLLLARVAREVTPWRIVLFDDRPERLSGLPSGIEGQVLPGYQGIPALPPTTYVVVATETHATDFLVAYELLRQEPGPAYLGMLGSKAKAAEIKAKLLEKGVAQERVQKLRCPVGLPLGGKDPGSVAISILSEILAFHHGRLEEAQTRLSS